MSVDQVEGAVFPTEPEPISQDKMVQLIALSTRAGELEDEIGKLEEQASLKNKELAAILGGYQQPGHLVMLMQETGVMDITLANGTRIIVNEELKAPSMAAGGKYREVTVDWLKKTGNGDIIKAELTVNIPKGKEALADEVQKFAVESHGLQVKRFETVNSQTLGSLLREMLESGADVPLDQIGAMIFRRAEVIKIQEK